jgi:sec-independent protein translocase protein TatA
MSIWHWLILLAVGLLMFGGKGKISSIMADVADGIKSFKKGMADDKPAEPSEPAKPEPPKVIEAVKPAEMSPPASTTASTAPTQQKVG